MNSAKNITMKCEKCKKSHDIDSRAQLFVCCGKFYPMKEEFRSLSIEKQNEFDKHLKNTKDSD